MTEGPRGWTQELTFYDCATAPSPRRVRIFLAEKGIALPTVAVDLRHGEQFGAAFRAINPDCTVPALKLGNGGVITDAVAICRYIEEVAPEPPLMGAGAEDLAVVETWQRRAERDGFYAAMEAFRNATPGLKERALPGPENHPQIAALAERGRARVGHFYAAMDSRLAENEFVAGARYSIADITTLVSVDFAGWAKLAMPDDRVHLRRWYAAVTARPSAKA